jgi:hypothetical protein
MYDFSETNNGYKMPINRFVFREFSFAKFKMHNCHMQAALESADSFFAIIS